MLRAQLRLGFLATHTIDPGGWRALPKAPLCALGQALDLVFSSRKWDQTAAEGGVRTEGLWKWLEAPRGPWVGRARGLGHWCWAPLEDRYY